MLLFYNIPLTIYPSNRGISEQAIVPHTQIARFDAFRLDGFVFRFLGEDFRRLVSFLTPKPPPKVFVKNQCHGQEDGNPL